LLLETTCIGKTQDEPLLSVADVARRLAVSTATVYELCGSGKLPHLRLLNTIRVRPADLSDFVNASVKPGGG
jgi:excisionase family DNA binding protein